MRRVLLPLWLLLPSSALGAGLTPEQEAAIDERVASPRKAASVLELTPGDTALVEHVWTLPASQLRQLPSVDMEPVLTDAVGPSGVRIEPRGEIAAFRQRGTDVEVHFIVSVRASEAPQPGPIRYTLTLIERRGLGNILAREKIGARVAVAAPDLKPHDLARDFYGYRLYKNRAIQFASRAQAEGVNLSLKSRIPSLSRGSRRAVVAVRGFEVARRRMGIARRHLVVARLNPDPELSSLATRYLKNLDLPQKSWVDAPNVPILPDAGPASGAAGAAGAETLSESTPDDSGVLAPITTYEPGTESERDAPEAEVAATPPPPALDPVQPETTTRQEPGLVAEDSLVPGQKVYEDLPNYPRGLRLDDPNIAFAGSTRFTYAEAQLQESAVTAAVFYFVQAGFTPRIGLEATLPTQYVDLETIEAESTYAAGNPLIALKYRFFLPDVERKAPALTVRARYGIPLSPPNKLRPTDITAETFSSQAYVVDTYAFLADYHDLGIGASLAWQYGWLTFNTQFYLDYFFPVDSTELGDFANLSYGMGVGALPFGDIVGGFAELRAISILRGSGRTEAMADFGFRGRFFDLLEPAVFLGIPIGSVSGNTSIQFGVELRVSYDLVAKREVPGADL